MASWTETGVVAGLGDEGIEGRLAGFGSWQVKFPELFFLLIKEEKKENGFCYAFVPMPLDSERIFKVGLV